MREGFSVKGARPEIPATVSKEGPTVTALHPFNLIHRTTMFNPIIDYDKKEI